jgi:hypothetical protein
MNEFYQAKFNELFAEFNRYLVEHPAFTERIPSEAEVILLDERDPGYNRYVLSGLQMRPSDTAVVYIDVGELAPVRSRLRNPRIVARPAAPLAR